ncbi:MAG TPA: DMT family transporter [Rubrivivax sp.]|nr:DMT family transporter [Rubrivivax sp.]
MTQTQRPADLAAIMPLVFVLIWSTGFVVARFGMPYAPPMGFLAWRFALSVLAFGVWVLLSRAAWPKGRAQWLHLAVIGVLIHAGYLGGVWSAVKLGIGAGTSALIVGLQPVLTALWVAMMAPKAQASAAQGGAVALGRPGRDATGQERRVTPRQWLGLALGLCGLVLVVWHKLGHGEVTPTNLALCLMALLAITIGTLYQKRFVAPCDVRTANMVQLMAAFVVVLPLALLESEAVQPTPALFGAMAWSVLVLTLGGSSLLYMMVQRGAATRVTSLMFLVPPCTSILAWLLFDELLTPLVLAGLVLTAVGVGLVVREPARQDQPRLETLR